ncbi:hypothetical protein LAZ67_11002105 [Cordylochernes scorpioides]|uniref:Uncharacterized protein n=1 Tax=Cordylochernes scorpioides TaxID=51811 RepID=A0ABY6KYY0_9ARAC|nr:hypothetical protein LAZ67_11002105 [Cordylochernes scorpioides]
MEIVDSKFLKESHGHVQKLRETIRQKIRNDYLGQSQLEKVMLYSWRLITKKRTEWPIGVIENTYPGKDSIVRDAMMKIKRENFETGSTIVLSLIQRKPS